MKINKRATSFVALFVFSTVTVWAQKSETYKDIIEKSFNLSLQKERTQAANLLVNSLKKESKKGVAQKDLLNALEKVITVFYSDKAQQIYEIGISLAWTDPTLALAKLTEAAQLEPGNFSIEAAAVRAMISANNCNLAAKNLESLKEMSDPLEDLHLLEAQVLLCNAKLESYKTMRPIQNLKRKDKLGLWWSLLEVEYFFKTGLLGNATELLNNLLKKWENYPEIYYWRHRIESELKQKSGESPQKYLTLCKSFSARQQRDFQRDPWLCRRTTEVENQLKKNNNSEI